MSYARPDITVGAKSFAPGYLDEPEADALVPGATPDAANVLLSRLETQDQVKATMRRRYGHRLINPTAMVSQASIDGLFNFERDNAASELLAVCNGDLYEWDGATTFNNLATGIWTAGNLARMLAFKNQACIHDGAAMRLYDGTTVRAVGYAGPTGASTLTAVAPAGAGVTGTYEGFVVYYDSAHDHESNRSALSAQVAFAGQDRNWTRPAGAPPANVDFWRIYVRRVDTYENRFRRVATVAIATAAHQEAISDTARVDAGPDAGENEPPPGAFAVMEEYLGYALGVLANASDLYISKRYDVESWPAKQKFPIGGRGDSKPVRNVRKFGTDVLIRKPTKTYILSGQAVPFRIDPIDSSLGSVAQEAGIEVNGRWFDWDEQRGPYWTDTVNWVPLGDGRITRILATVNRAALTQIRVFQAAKFGVIGWAVPTTSTRRRTILPYSYILDRWLPPMTGMEWTAFTNFTTTAGDLATYCGDEWGRVFAMFETENDGVLSGDTSGAITGATSGTITCAAAAFYTTGSGLAGIPAIVEAPDGSLQIVRVQSNTGTVLTLDTTDGPPLSPVPATDGTWTVYVGGINWYWFTPQLDFGDGEHQKEGRNLYIEGGSTSPAHVLHVDLLLDRSSGRSERVEVTFPATGMVWGSGTWGADVWGASAARAGRKRRLTRAFFTAQLRFSNFKPDQPFELTAYKIAADVSRGRRVQSV